MKEHPPNEKAAGTFSAPTATPETRQQDSNGKTEKCNSRFRSGDISASELVPQVIVDFAHQVCDPVVDGAPRRRMVDICRLLAVLDEIRNDGGDA
jgi:hypothetical protein